VRTGSSRLADVWIGLATALAILALTIPLFLNPVWVAFEQGRSGASVWTGFSDADLRRATDSILSDLVFGPPEFAVEVGGAPVLDQRERSHMRDVRMVFGGFFVLAVIATATALVLATRRRAEARRATWAAVRGGAVGLIVTLVVLAGIALVAFDALFETFHQVLFPSGSYDFDPRTERLVQIFPFDFWQDSAIAVGVVATVLAVLVGALAHRRLGRAAAASEPIARGLERSRP
jgi:integral membrane protein (TIGR01906 family)